MAGSAGARNEEVVPYDAMTESDESNFSFLSH